MNNLFIDNLFSVESKHQDVYSVVLADCNHPVFLAHFESNPILPGFLHIDMLASIYNIEILGVKKAKYFEIIRPLETLLIRKLSAKNEVVIFEISKHNGVVASKIELIVR